MTPGELISIWTGCFHYLKRAHYEAASACEWWHFAFGFGGILFNGVLAAVGVGFVKYLSGQGNDAFLYLMLVVLLTILVTCVATAQVFMRFAERSERHRAAGARYAELESEGEKLMLILASKPDGDHSEEIESLRDEWRRLTAANPIIPNRFFEQYKEDIEGVRWGARAKATAGQS